VINCPEPEPDAADLSTSFESNPEDIREPDYAEGVSVGKSGKPGYVIEVENKEVGDNEAK
jgi:hypothetical protein